MRKLALALALCAASALAGANLAIQPAMAGVAPAGPIPAMPANGLDEVQYRWNGRSYCFYFDGWNGPGWYRCGWRHRRGMGWGGPTGWRGWDAPRGGMYHERPRGREMDRDRERGGERAPRRDMERAPERGPDRGMDRRPERGGAAPGGTERRPPAGVERGAAPGGGERGAAPGGRPPAGGGERRPEPGAERPRDVRPPAGAPPAGGGAAPGPN